MRVSGSSTVVKLSFFANLASRTHRVQESDPNLRELQPLLDEGEDGLNFIHKDP